MRPFAGAHPVAAPAAAQNAAVALSNTIDETLRDTALPR